MAAFDTGSIQRTLHARIATETDEIVRRNLHMTEKHVQAEIDGDLDAIMATLVSDPIYHFHNLVDGSGTPQTSIVTGREAVHAMYAAGVADGTIRQQELRDGRVAADRNFVVFEGIIRVAWAGSSLVATGYDADSASAYLMEGRICVLVPFAADGLLLGEDVYFDPNGFKDILSRRIGDIPLR